jgi:hypothetical protein
MSRIKLVNFYPTIMPKPPKTNNVLINVVVDVTTCNQELK